MSRFSAVILIAASGSGKMAEHLPLHLKVTGSSLSPDAANRESKWEENVIIYLVEFLSFKISKNWHIQIVNFTFIKAMTVAKWHNTRLIISRLRVRVQMTPMERENGGKNNNLLDRGFVV